MDVLFVCAIQLKEETRTFVEILHFVQNDKTFGIYLLNLHLTP